MTAMINMQKKAARERAMWISALVLAVVLVVQLVGFPERPAHAAPFPGADVATSGDYTMVTLPTSSEDLLVVLDSRNESISVYRVENKKMFQWVAGGDVRSLFAVGRQKGAGSK